MVCLDQHESLPGVGSQANDPATRFHQAIGRDLEAAVKYARRAVQLDTTNEVAWHLWGRAAFSHYRALNWQGAEQDARLAIKLAAGNPKLHVALFEIAPLLLLAGKQKEYEQFCVRLLDDQEATKTGRVHVVVGLCTLDPKTAGDPSRVLRLAQRLADSKNSWERRPVAMAHFRAGNYQEGIELLQDQNGPAEAQFSLVALQMAIAHHYDGDHQQAREWLDNAIRRLQDWDPGYAYYRARTEVFRREAESLIQGGDSAEREGGSGARHRTRFTAEGSFTGSSIEQTRSKEADLPKSQTGRPIARRPHPVTISPEALNSSPSESSRSV